MTSVRHRRLTCAALILAMATLAGCADEPKKASGDPSTAETTSTPPTESSADQSESASEEATEEETESEPVDAEESFFEAAEAAFANATTAQVTQTLSAGGRGEGQVDLTGRSVALQMDLEPGDGQLIQVILIKGNFYLKYPGFGDKWRLFAADDPNNPLKALGAQLDPAASLDSLRPAILGVTYDGELDLNGEAMDVWTTTIDPTKITGELAEGISQADLPRRVDYQWWIDGEGYFRQFISDFGKKYGSVTVNYDDWGSEVTIEAPAPDEISN